MKVPDLLNHFQKYNLFNKINQQIISANSDKLPLYTSHLYGAIKSFLINEVASYKDQILVLTPDAKLATELYIELEFLNEGLKKILINDFKSEQFQEKLTEISNTKVFVLIKF